MNLTPGIAMDILAAVILLFSMIQGARSGFARTLVSFVQWFGRIIAGFFLCTSVKEYIIRDIVTDDEEMDAFLFSLGCYSGEPITVISHLKGGCVVSIKDARYNIDNQLAEAIVV